MGKMGRQRIEIDFKKIDSLCSVFCNCQEIVSVLNAFDVNCSYDTVERRIKEQFNMTFAEYVEQKQMAFAKPKLRKAQFDCALGGNATMLIWLGKQYLGQVEKQDINVTGDMSDDVSAKIEEIKAKYNDKK
jgi:AraC-like DNA-binding protein